MLYMVQKNTTCPCRSLSVPAGRWRTQDLTNFFGLAETDDDLNDNYDKLFPA